MKMKGEKIYSALFTLLGEKVQKVQIVQGKNLHDHFDQSEPTEERVYTKGHKKSAV